MNIELKSVELANGEKMGYRERKGGREIMILVHGNMTSSKHWDLFMENFNPDYKLLAVDLRGFGISSYKQSINSLHDFARDLKQFVDKMELKNFNLMGWSTGGGICMDFAADHPDYVKKLILLESVGTRGYPILKKDEEGNPIPGKFLRTKKEIASDPVQVIPVKMAQDNNNKEVMKQIWNSLIYTDNQPDPERYNQYLEDMMSQRNLIDVDYALANFNISSEHNGIKEGNGKATQIKAPTLVLWGENDKVVPEKMARDIKNDIGEEAKIVYLEGCGHSPFIDDLDQLLAKVNEFMAKNQ